MNDGSMIIRNTELSELDCVMEIYDSARMFMRECGNMSQWVNGYPTRALIESDIRNGMSRVCTDCDSGEILAVFCYFYGSDPTYAHIYDGEWLTHSEYGVVHRIASNVRGRGVASFCFEKCLEEAGVLRIDTHADNSVMQHTLIKNGFTRCGVIYIEDGTPRIAFEKVH